MYCDHRFGNYSREETSQRQKLVKDGNYLRKYSIQNLIWEFWKKVVNTNISWNHRDTNITMLVNKKFNPIVNICEEQKNLFASISHSSHCWSTCVQVCYNWLLDHVIYHKLRRKIIAKHLFSLKMTTLSIQDKFVNLLSFTKQFLFYFLQFKSFPPWMACFNSNINDLDFVTKDKSKVVKIVANWGHSWWKQLNLQKIE